MPVPQLSIQLLNFASGPTADWGPLLVLAQIADAVGVDRVVVSDHVVFGENLEAYGQPSLGGVAGGRQPTSPDGHWLEPLTLLSVIAGQTSQVRLGTAVLLAALRPAAVLAKQTATLDVLSGGRLDLGVGVGWQREEYEAVGQAFDDRGTMLDECLVLCRRLWTEPVVDGEFASGTFNRVHAMPKPAQAGGVPIWVSGRATARTARRLAEFGIGWIPWGDDVPRPQAGIEMMRLAFESAGRDPSTLEVQGVLPVVRTEGVVDIDATAKGVPELAAAGVTDFRFPMRWGQDPDAEAVLLREVVLAFRSAVGRPTPASQPATSSG